MDPISAFTVLAATFKVGEKLGGFCLSYSEVDAETRTFLAMITRVRLDLEEAFRERQDKQTIFESLPPGKRAWIDGVIIDVENALNNIGIVIENARIDLERKGIVTVKHHFEWVLNNNQQKLLTEETRLATCHRSLVEALNMMHNLQAGAFSFAPPAYHTLPARLEQETMDEDSPVLRGPSQRRPKSLRHKTEQSPTATSLHEVGSIPRPLRLSRALHNLTDSDRVQDLQLIDLRKDTHPTPSHGKLSPNSSPPQSHNPLSPLSPSAPVLPEIQQSTFSFKEYILTDEPDGAKALSAATEALDAQGTGLSNLSLITDSGAQTRIQERRPRAIARYNSE